MNPPSVPQEEIRHLGGCLARARAAVTRGEAADLSGVEPRVAALCADVQRLPGEEARALRSGLLALLEELDELHRALEQGLGALKAEIGESGQRRRALHAYNRQG